MIRKTNTFSRTLDGYPRWALSFLLALVQLTISVGWVTTNAAPVLPGRVSWVAEAEAWWPLLFGVAGLVLLTTTVLRRAQAIGHSLCAGACGGYALASWVGVLLSTPTTNPTTAAAMVGLAGTHYFVSAMYRRATR